MRTQNQDPFAYLVQLRATSSSFIPSLQAAHLHVRLAEDMRSLLYILPIPIDLLATFIHITGVMMQELAMQHDHDIVFIAISQEESQTSKASPVGRGHQPQEFPFWNRSPKFHASFDIHYSVIPGLQPLDFT